jgi:polyisoprenoid-binding protein YceI
MDVRGDLFLSERRSRHCPLFFVSLQGNIARDVLEPGKYPEISFRSRSVERTGSTVRVQGSLDLHGVRRDIAFDARQQGDRWVARVPVNQPDFRIKPYQALLGALRVKPEVVVEVSVPSS